MREWLGCLFVLSIVRNFRVGLWVGFLGEMFVCCWVVKNIFEFDFFNVKSDIVFHKNSYNYDG